MTDTLLSLFFFFFFVGVGAVNLLKKKIIKLHAKTQENRHVGAPKYPHVNS